MSRPDAPTPRTDAAWDEEWRMKAAEPNSDPAHGMCDFAMQLERELDLAQTEIKGHMKMEDELKAELAEYQAKHTAIMREADRRYDELIAHDQDNLAELDKAQSRIAELEKDAARYRWLRDCTDLNRPIAIFFDSTKYGSEVNTPEATDAAIDAALKGRA